MMFALLTMLVAATAAPGAPSAGAKADPPAVGAVGAPAATPTTWPAWRGDGLQRGRSPSSLTAPLTSLWSFKLGDAVVAGAVVDEASVYVGAKDGTFAALDRQTGQPRWTVKADGPIEAPGLRVGDLVVFGAKDHVVRALRASTGEEIWRVDVGSEVIAAPAFVPAQSDLPAGVLVGDYGGELTRLDLASGASRWTYATGSYLYGSPAVLNDVAVLGGCDGYVHTVHLVTGAAITRVEVGAYVGASVAVASSDGGLHAMAYTGHFGNKVVAFDPRGGATTWTHFDRAFPYLSSAAIADEVIILGGRDRVVRALERTTGELWWLFPTGAKVDSSPVIAGDAVVVGSEDGRLYVLDLEDGDQRQAVDLGAPVTASPAVAGGVVYVGAGDGTVHALGPKAKPGKKERP